MQKEIDKKIEILRADYNKIAGKPFAHFFCPIIHKDEKVQLCKAHIVNRAFPSSPRAWTVQRKDVDGFYGSNFESDFVPVKYRENLSLGDTISDKKLSKIFKTEILVDDKPVEYFVVNKNVPKNFTGVEFDNDGQIIRLVFKMSPEKFISLVDHNWEMTTSKDVRISAMVSLIKSAHLTLFENLGYRYALSPGGIFVGRNILGEFFLQNRKKQKLEVFENAKPFFRKYANMVRPVVYYDFDIKGTITDKLMFICWKRNGLAWAIIVFIKISQTMYNVLIPIYDNPERIEMFENFMINENEILKVSMCRFNQDGLECNDEVSDLYWPKTGVLYPE